MNMIKLDLVLLCQLGGQTGEKTYAHETRRYTLSFLMHLQSLHAYDTKLGLCSFFFIKKIYSFYTNFISFSPVRVSRANRQFVS